MLLRHGHQSLRDLQALLRTARAAHLDERWVEGPGEEFMRLVAAQEGKGLCDGRNLELPSLRALLEFLVDALAVLLEGRQELGVCRKRLAGVLQVLLGLR